MQSKLIYSEIEYIQKILSSVWPEWKVTKRLGKGTYGAVYEILRDDLENGYKCALKILQMQSEEPALSGNNLTINGQEDHTLKAIDQTKRLIASVPYRSFETMYGGEESLEAFVRNVSDEIKLMIQLKGAPGIVSIEDYAVLRDKNSRTILIRMEELESIDHYFQRIGFVTKEDVIRLGMDICKALEFCEQSNILHRDIKPQNLFFSDRAGFKLGDFGISRRMDSIHKKMAMSGVGTIQYMAPEIYHGMEYNNTVDIYSLGIVLYILMNDNIPPLYSLDERKITIEAGWDEAALRSANMRRLRGERLPMPSRADKQFGTVICRACDPDPEMRFQSAGAFREALLSCLTPEKESETPTSSHPKGPDMRFLLVGLAVLLIVIAVVLALNSSQEKVDEHNGGTAASATGEETEKEDSGARPEDQVSTGDSDGQLGEETGGGEEDHKEAVYTVYYRDQENGNDLAGPQTGYDIIGTQITLTPVEIEGYSLIPTEPVITISEDESENTYIFLYKKTPASIVYNTDGHVSILCKKYERSQFQDLIDSFSKESGIKVSAQVVGTEEYPAALEEGVTGSRDDPTLFILSGYKDFEKYGHACLDITDSSSVQELNDTSFVLKGSNGKTYGLPCFVESFGLTVNTRLLEEAGYSVFDLNSFQDLKSIVRDITSRKNELGFSAFTCPSIGVGVDGSYRFAQHAPAVPLYYEIKDMDFNIGTALQGSYLDQYKDFIDLYINNSTVTGDDITGHTLREAQQEFIQGKAVFHQDGSWSYEDLRSALDENAAVIPLYMGIPGEEYQGLSKTCSYFWCVNQYASEDDREASLQFLQWLTTSEEALRIMTEEMGFAVPYRMADAPDNLYSKTLYNEEESGKDSVIQYYKYGEYSEWTNALDHAIENYARGSGSWDDVRSAFISLW